MRFACSYSFAACLTLAPADSVRGDAVTIPVMEVVTFRLIDGIREADFVARAEATRAALTARPGFLHRSLLRDDNGLWTDLVAWRSQTEAEAAARAMIDHRDFAPFLAAIDMGTVAMRHSPIQWQMGD